MPLSLRYGIVCEDIRREDNGKLILIGVFARDIGISNFPASLVLALCVSMEVDEPGDFEIEFQFLFRDEISIQGKTSITINDPGLGMIVIPRFPIENITGEGGISFRFRQAGSEWQTVASLPIVSRASTTCPPPS
ncbi:MAG: hypothetical protein U1E38_01205 [Rhodospirillales bacterium]